MSHCPLIAFMMLVLLTLVQKSVLEDSLHGPNHPDVSITALASKEDSESLHGPDHPAVSITAGREPLQHVSASEMELTFNLWGAVPGFSYKILVQERGPENEELQVKWELFRFEEDACNPTVSLLLRHRNVPQDRFRFIVSVWDNDSPYTHTLVGNKDFTTGRPVGVATSKCVSVPRALEYRTKPGNIVSTCAPNPVAVSLVTQCSIDRLPRLKVQALAYGSGPISVAIYVPGVSSKDGDEGNEQAAALAQIRQFHSDVSARGACVTISLLFANAPAEAQEYDNLYPIQNLRNLALDAAPTSLVFLVDVDFIPSPGLSILGSGMNDPNGSISLEACRDMCNAGSVLVVPAFEMQPDVRMPQTRADLEATCLAGRAEGFQQR